MKRDQAAAEPGDRAIAFWMTLTSGEATDADRHACAVWRAADPAHERAWGRLQQGLNQSVGRLESVMKTEYHALRSTLERPARRRILLNAAGLVGAAAVGAWATDHVTPLGNVLADLGTATGERRSFTLPDGSMLTLDARSRVDLAFAGRQHSIRLLEGALLLQPREDPLALFEVLTPHGQVRSAGASCMVRLERQSSLAVALQSRIEVLPRAGEPVMLDAGEGTRFGQTWADRPQPMEYAAAWQEGWLKVRDQPLGTVVAALERYRTGLLRVSPQAATLAVSGLYPLDDADRALSALEHTLPITVSRYTRWLTVIDVRAA
ncbi:FecR domain-containing protein [Bordetella holmesii]|uniref:Sigma factor regulatory protein, FecR/PupR family n=2 Tax=Bordetella holmesii TaxID=35814 RepID=A0A158M6Q4_9BORD|nr:FecR domain-containing protein [Bordetella holmesii]AIT24834.1 fecR family protein [Bordetella holmesii 44057]EWM45405.1 fecR family protein [Bordetella holmesii 70147]EWM48778.1 fecR family protein [Bordetella holmesii 41130]EWM49520.1 fecR family protein [Bordetella holmesii 35009]AMD44117.1 iron dicitrate transport regulator FecR [Bordetella holmesii H558]